MVSPAMVGLVAGQSVLGYVTARRYDRAVRESNRYLEGYYNGAYHENRRFWNDYIRAHHLGNRKIRYPYRTGYYYNMSALQNARVRAVSSQNSLYRAGYGGLVSLGYSVRPRGPRTMNIYNYR